MSGGPNSGSSSSSGSGTTNILSKYVIPGLEAIGGAVSEFFAPGNPFGVGLIGSGVGQLAGGAAGGSQGQSIGGTLGGVGGGIGGSIGGGATSSASPLTALDQAAAENYALPTTPTTSTASTGTGSSMLANALGAGASSLGNLMNASKLQPPPNAPVLSKNTGTISNPAPPSPVQTVGAYMPGGSGSGGLNPQLMQLVAQLLQGRTA